MSKIQVNTMTLALALELIEGVKTVQKDKDLPPFNITVVDDSGLLTAFNRQDGSLKGSLQVSQLKANSSALFRLTTRTIKDLAFGDGTNAPTEPGMVHIPGVLAVPGGVPVFNAEGTVIGAIGVSGANDDDDEMAAITAIEKAKASFDLQ